MTEAINHEKFAEMLREHTEFGDFTLSSGAKSNYYIDIKSMCLDPENLEIVANEIADLIPDDTHKIMGLEMGSVPIVAAVSLKKKIPYVILRKNDKDYGKKGRLIGQIDDDDNITIIDDVFTSGKSLQDAAKFVFGNHATPNCLVAVIDRSEDNQLNVQSIAKITEERD